MQPAYLDLTTLSVVIMTVTAFLCATMIFVWRVQRTYPGFGLWTLANLVAAIGFFFLILHGILPDFMTMILGNYLAVATNLLCLEGNRKFLGLSSNRWFDAGVIALYAPLMAYFTFFDNNVASRIVVSSLCLAVISASSWYIFNRAVQKDINFTYKFARITYFAFAVMMLLRAILTLTYSQITDFYAPDTIQSVVYLMFIVFAVLWRFQYLILNNERLQQELQSAQVELENLAKIDFLTGVNNKRNFFEIGNNEIQRAERFPYALTVLMFDIDHFKQVNDTHGHAAGDLVLTEIAEICKRNLRAVDVLGRLGGEEFAIILPDTNASSAEIVAEHLRSLIEESEIEFLTEKIKVTASFGIAAFNGADEQIEIILERADAALYEAKRAGRNRVVIADSPKANSVELRTI
jgi:diguanylate cyclase (GGDEF)-like protein